MNNSSQGVVSSSSNGISLIYSFSAISVVGLFFNSLIIVIVYYRNVIPGKIPRTYFLNEFIGQWFCCLFRSLAWFSDQNLSVPDNEWGTLVCRLFFTRALYFSFVHATYSNIVLMSIERYISVIHPVKHKKFTALFNAFLIFLSWASAPARVYARYQEVSRRGSSCIILPIDNRASGVLLSIWGVFLPVAVIACLNGRVIYMLKKQADKMGTHSHNSALNHSAATRRKLQRELTYSVSILCLTYSISVFPSMILYYLTTFGVVKVDLRSVPFQILSYFQSFFFVVNPLIFMLQMHSLRREVVAIIRCNFLRAAMMREEYDVTSSKEAASHVAPREATYTATISAHIHSVH